MLLVDTVYNRSSINPNGSEMKCVLHNIKHYRPSTFEYGCCHKCRRIVTGPSVVRASQSGS